MKKFLIVVLLLGAGGVFAYKHFFQPEKRACTKLAELCGDKAKDVDQCATDMADMRKSQLRRGRQDLSRGRRLHGGRRHERRRRRGESVHEGHGQSPQQVV